MSKKSLNIDSVTEIDSYDALNQILKEQLNISLDDMIDALTESVKSNSKELAGQFVNIAPKGDYSLLLEDKEKMAEFLATEASQPQYWIIKSMANDRNQSTRFVFSNDAVDDGTTFKGYVIVNAAGVIKHAFAQGEE